MTTNKSVMLDAGHYGKYNKGVVDGYYESNIAWQLTELVYSKLQSHNVNVGKTREDKNKDLDVLSRGKLAKNYSILISFHTNASSQESTDYAAACVFSGDSELAKQSQSLGTLLSDIVKQTMNLSKSTLIKKLSSNDRDKNGVLDDEYYGLLEGAREVNVPAIILECGFHTNTKTCNWLMNNNNLELLATNITNGILEFIGEKKEEQTQPSQPSQPSQTQPSTNNKFTQDDIFGFFISHNLTPQGAAGLLGNMKAESNLSSINLQNSFNNKLNMTDEEYTKAVDNNTYTNFVNDGAGYGLCQWTYNSRKQNLKQFAESKNVSIGDLLMQCEFCLSELKTSYKNLFNLLTITTSIKEASDAVLTQFEKPADQSDKVKEYRLQLSTEMFNKYNTVSNNENNENKEENTKTEDIKDEGDVKDSPIFTTTSENHYIRVINNNTPIFEGVEFNSGIVMTVNKNEVFTVVEEINKYYKLKSGVGFIRKSDVYDYDFERKKNPFPVPQRILQYGDIGEDVKWLKFELLQYGLGTFNYENPNFYTKVYEALRKYQQIMGLTVDGLCGPKTIEALQKDGF